MKKNKNEPEDKAALRLKEFLDAREPDEQTEETGNDPGENEPKEKNTDSAKKTNPRKLPETHCNDDSPNHGE